MNSTQLLSLFRTQTRDDVQPYLWSDVELYAYMNDAYSMFVRLTGGVSDFTSDICEVPVIAGEGVGYVSRKILFFNSARRASDNLELRIVNQEEMGGTFSKSDYGWTRRYKLDDRVGPLCGMVIGMQEGVVRWLDVPEKDDLVLLSVDRLPLNEITGAGQCLTDVDEIHHIHLLKWMKAMAYLKEDAETFDSNAAERNEVLFRTYCQEVRNEIARRKHKPRTVSYGGI